MHSLSKTQILISEHLESLESFFFLLFQRIDFSMNFLEKTFEIKRSFKIDSEFLKKKQKKKEKRKVPSIGIELVGQCGDPFESFSFLSTQTERTQRRILCLSLKESIITPHSSEKN